MKKESSAFIFSVAGVFFMSVFFVCLVGSPARAEGPTIVPQYITSATTWIKEGSPYIVKSNVYIQAPLKIELGVVVKFYAPSYQIHINAEFSARGTKSEKVVFTSIHDDSDGVDSDAEMATPRDPKKQDWGTININPSKKVEFNNVAIRYGNVALKALSSGSEHENLTILNSEISDNVTGIYMENVEPKLEFNTFSGNNSAVSFFNNRGLERELTLSRNSFSGNGYGVYAYNTDHLGVPCAHAEHNWWGDASGPYDPNDNPDGKGDAVQVKYVLYDPWLQSDPNTGPDPVIIIPGIMGSATKYPGGIGELEIDPILHTYDNLIATLEKNGYEEQKNLFEFPYEWRDSNVQTAQKLKEKIDEVKDQTGRPRVDLVAHSMGGLVARYYIEGDGYEDDVDQLITLGTPHKGSPKSYLTWEAGEGFFTILDKLAKKFFEMEAKHSGFDNLKEYIQGRVFSVKELLPDYSYLKEVSDNTTRNYSENYPRNNFLELLNTSDRLGKLEEIAFTNIISDTERNNTIGGFRVVESEKGDMWEHGMPENYYDDSTDQGIEYGSGDETVPFSSADGIENDKKIVLNSSHGDIPTAAQCEVFRELTGVQDCSDANVFDKVSDILTFDVFSPVDIQVESPSGEKIGKDFETGEDINEIEGAFYTGHDTENEFITIPSPENGEYKVTAQGTDKGGEYKIDVVRIESNEDDFENAKESKETINGFTKPGEIREMSVDIKLGEVDAVNIETIRESVEHYFEFGYIINKGEINYCFARIDFLEKLFDQMDSERKNKKPVENIEKEINLQIDHLIEHIQKNQSSKIDPHIAEIIINDLNFIKINN
ncbi:MAG: alpha/beta hydrolase [Candidatus Moranbacteria bacterium]|nr:alpha/beta hydrolase [Candidatus Moranbacteria bacterium]